MQVTSYNVVTKYSCGTSFKEVDADQLIPTFTDDHKIIIT